jgi:hypothetical protein
MPEKQNPPTRRLVGGLENQRLCTSGHGGMDRGARLSAGVSVNRGGTRMGCRLQARPSARSWGKRQSPSSSPERWASSWQALVPWGPGSARHWECCPLGPALRCRRRRRCCSHHRCCNRSCFHSHSYADGTGRSVVHANRNRRRRCRSHSSIRNRTTRRDERTSRRCRRRSRRKCCSRRRCCRYCWLHNRNSIRSHSYADGTGRSTVPASRGQNHRCHNFRRSCCNRHSWRRSHYSQRQERRRQARPEPASEPELAGAERRPRTRPSSPSRTQHSRGILHMGFTSAQGRGDSSRWAPVGRPPHRLLSISRVRDQAAQAPGQEGSCLLVSER